MISREEKNKVYVNEINHEKTIAISKKILKAFLTIIILFTIIFLYIYYLGPKGLTVKERVLKDNNIPSSFHGIKIMHFTDVLYGKTINQKEINKLAEQIKLVNPDVVFFTGNIISKDYQTKENEIKELNSFFKNIPYSIGKYAIKGDSDNHTFDLIMEDTNFIILNNESYDIFNNTNEKIKLIGINTNEIKELTNDNSDYTITLINNYDDYAKYNITSNLVFAGHNLGGEIRFFNLPLLGNDKYQEEYYQNGNTNIYISSGLGTIHHMRLMNKPSINVYRLYNN